MLINWKRSLNAALQKHISCRFVKSHNSGNCKNKEKNNQNNKQRSRNIKPTWQAWRNELTSHTLLSTQFLLGYLSMCWQKRLVLNLKCLWHDIFYNLIRRGFRNDEGWLLFYCNSTLGCRVIQDFYLCKLDDLWRHNVDTKWFEITKKLSISHGF